MQEHDSPGAVAADHPGGASAAPMRLTLEPGGSFQVRHPEDLVQALRSWGRAPGSVVVLESASGQVLQAAGEQAQGFVLEYLDGDAPPLQTWRDNIGRAELLRRLQAFLRSGGEAGPRAAWRRGRRWLSEPERSARRPARPGVYWGRWAAALLAMQLVSLLLWVPAALKEREMRDFERSAVRYPARVISNEPASVGARRCSPHRVVLAYRTGDGPGPEQRWSLMSCSQLKQALPGDAHAVWVGAQGQRLADEQLVSQLFFVGVGVFFQGLSLLLMLLMAWQDRFRPRPLSPLGVLRARLAGRGA